MKKLIKKWLGIRESGELDITKIDRLTYRIDHPTIDLYSLLVFGNGVKYTEYDDYEISEDGFVHFYEEAMDEPMKITMYGSV